VPDFIISSEPPLGARGAMPSGWLVGDFKASSATFYNAYVSPGLNRAQFNAIADYARKHTYTKTAVYIVGWNNLGSHKRTQSKEWKQIRSLLGKQLTRKGVIGLMVTVLN
jgi:hypothetical protein